MRVLLAEDNPRFANLIAEGLEAEGFVLDRFGSLSAARESVALDRYDLFLIDLGMPDGDGIDFVRAVRRAGNTTPILVITARNGLGDRVGGLDSGADDYLVKPFDMPELAARCRALLRRPGGCLGTTLNVENLEFDTIAREVRISSRVIHVPPRECDLLERLMRRAGHVVSKASLEDTMYALSSEVSPNALEAVVSRLRRRLAAEKARVVLHTAHGIGYMLASAAQTGRVERGAPR
ncbi:response regulator transcription factor [Xanthobacter autotrophicus]|uniref:response regulator transcription factor n=1 Tax=Xanthobacter autotrophicus TaxID=280 RepID=UPI0024AC249B|nr:response regulator transcription factor [Xanthobacter autotrophicus]MDI4665677.1 response regulator transcription factor [Xanthobacter autotrophicus]